MVYDHDSNLIEGVALKSRNAKVITKKWQKLYDKITANTVTTKYWILDNEASKYLKDALGTNDQNYQLTPPHIHRINAAERAIRTYKNHLLAGIATCDKDYPIIEWDRLLSQCNITLNLLRNSRVNPGLSAYAYAYGEFDFNKTPLCPPGTKAIIHSKSNNRGSWNFHSKEGWTIGPALEHYRCIKCFMPDTNKEINADTLFLIPKHIPIPTPTLDAQLKATASQLIALIKKKRKPLPGLPIEDKTIQGLKQLADIFTTHNFNDQQSSTTNNTTTALKPKNQKKEKPSDAEFQKILQNIKRRNKPDLTNNHNIITKTNKGENHLITNQNKKPTTNKTNEGGNQHTIPQLRITSNTNKVGKPRLLQNTRKPLILSFESLQHLQQQNINHIYEGVHKFRWPDYYHFSQFFAKIPYFVVPISPGRTTRF